MLTKNQISEILSNVHFDSNKEDIISNGSVKNIVVFDKEIIIDLEILKPTLQAKNTIKRKIVDFPTPPLPEEIAMILEIFLIFFVELYIVGSFSEINIKLILTSILKSILLLRESTIFLISLQFHLVKVELENLL